MPVWKSRSNRALIWRPNGMLYAEGRHETNAGNAVDNAFREFQLEFHREPDLDQVIIEVYLKGDIWRASLFEVPIEP